MSKAFFGNVKRDEPNVTYVFVLVTLRELILVVPYILTVHQL
jgi:hypothetical protein